MKARTTMLAAALAVLLLAVAAVASGCGSTSSDDGVAALDDASTTTGDDGSNTSSNDERDPQEAALEWAKCMREHGIDVPDPEVEDNGGLRVRVGPGVRLDGDPEDFRDAQEECGTPFGDAGQPQLSEADREELQEAMLAFAKCMREHGVDMPDPEFSGEGGRALFRQRARGIDPNNETFRKAQEACQDLLGDTFPGRVSPRVGE